MNYFLTWACYFLNVCSFSDVNQLWWAKITLYLCVQPVGLIYLSFIFSVSCPSMQTAWHHWSLSRLNLSMFELGQNRSVDHVSVSVSVFIISASPSLMDFHYSYICMTEALHQQHIHIWLSGSEQQRAQATQACLLCKRLFILLCQQKRVDFCYQNMQSGLSVTGIVSTERMTMPCPGVYIIFWIA